MFHFLSPKKIPAAKTFKSKEIHVVWHNFAGAMLRDSVPDPITLT